MKRIKKLAIAGSIFLVIIISLYFFIDVFHLKITPLSEILELEKQPRDEDMCLVPGEKRCGRSYIFRTPNSHIFECKKNEWDNIDFCSLDHPPWTQWCVDGERMDPICEGDKYDKPRPTCIPNDKKCGDDGWIYECVESEDELPHHRRWEKFKDCGLEGCNKYTDECGQPSKPDIKAMFSSYKKEFELNPNKPEDFDTILHVKVLIGNIGRDMDRPWLLEVQVVKKGENPSKRTCDPTYSAGDINYQLKLDERSYIKIDGVFSETGKLDVYLLSSDVCCTDNQGNPLSCNKVGPYKTPKYVTTIDIPEPCFCHMDADCPDKYTCKNKKRLIVDYYCDCRCKKGQTNIIEYVECCSDEDCTTGGCVNYECTEAPSVGFELNISRILKDWRDLLFP